MFAIPSSSKTEKSQYNSTNGYSAGDKASKQGEKGKPICVSVRSATWDMVTGQFKACENYKNSGLVDSKVKAMRKDPRGTGMKCTIVLHCDQ